MIKFPLSRDGRGIIDSDGDALAWVNASNTTLDEDRVIAAQIVKMLNTHAALLEYFKAAQCFYSDENLTFEDERKREERHDAAEEAAHKALADAEVAQ